jgi:sialic acid synthase SpsE
MAAKILDDGLETFVSGIVDENEHTNAHSIYCVSEYPCYEIDLGFSFDDKYDGHSPKGYYGYSSHMHGYADALIAIARGAKYIEKHVTLGKDETSIRDHSFALSFQEFGEMVRIGREMSRLV